MILVTSILGAADDPALHDRLHRLEHAGRVETVTLARADLARRRLRARSDRGSDVAIALARDAMLFDKAVLALSDDLALVLRVEAESWLALRPRDAASALALGYHAGNLHWRVRFEGERLLVALEGDPQRYLDRLTDFLESGRAWIDPEHGAAQEQAR